MSHIEPIKLQVVDTTFYINEIKKTVTCRMSGCLKYHQFEDGDGNPLFLPSIFHTVTATAKCHPDDIFDVDKGRRIAKAKAEIKLYREIINGHLNRIMKHIDTFADAYGNFLMKAIGAIKANGKYIDKILGNKED